MDATETVEGTVIVQQFNINESLPDYTEKKQEEWQKKPSPPPGILKIKIIFLILGMSSLLAFHVVINGEGYFRSMVAGSYFEENFAIYFQALAVLGNLIGGFSTLFLNKKFSPRLLVLSTTATYGLPMLGMTVLAKVNTESWKEEFFAITLGLFFINAISHGVMTSSHSMLCTMIQPDILKIYYVGKGFAGIAGSAVALGTLAFPQLDVVSAAFYYLTVTTLLTLVGTTALTVYLLQLDLVKERTITVKTAYKEKSDECDGEATALSLLDIAKKIKVQAFSGLLITLSSLVIFPATLTSLRPIDENQTGVWIEKFFLPVSIFLVWSIGDTGGKVLSEFVSWPGKKQIIWFSAARLILVPLTIMTNIQPRTIPVWFKSDVVPSVLAFLTSFTGGHLMNLSFVYAPMYVEGKENKSRASMVIFFVVAIGLALGSACIFLVPVIVNP